jgi:MFS family permease
VVRGLKHRRLGHTPRTEPEFRRLAVFFGRLLRQGFAEPKAGIAAQPIFFLLKDELRLGAAETATFLALVGIAWSVKPLYGLLSDLVLLAGSRRRSYLLATTAMAALGWLVLGLLPGYPYALTLAILADRAGSRSPTCSWMR